VAQQPELIEPPRPPVRRHRGPTRRQIAVRRAVAVVFLAVVLGAVAWGAAIALQKVRGG
jgi:hypothetical protein